MSVNPRVYLDHNATTPVSPLVKERCLQWLEAWGNTSSIHFDGRKPKQLVREARKSVADHVGASPLEIVFTSGGSESNNMVLKGVLERSDRKHLVISKVEHPSIIKTANYIESKGYKVTYLPVCRSGQIDLEELKKVVTKDTALVSIMYANNETGNILPIKKAAKIAHAKGALFHSDMVQALGKAIFNVKDLNVDFASFSGHKFYTLKGIGALYIRSGLELEPLIHGGRQERARRAGTENVLAISSIGAMLSICKEEVRDKIEHIEILRNSMEKRILSEIDGVKVNGQGAKRLCNTSNLTINGISGESLLMNLDINGYSVSTGAACSSGNPEPSSVLMAMGLTRAEAQSSLRLSLGWGNTQEEIEQFVEVLKKTVTKLRSFQK